MTHAVALLGRLEIVPVTLASAISKGLALLSVLVVVIPSNTSPARSHLLRQIASSWQPIACRREKILSLVQDTN